MYARFGIYGWYANYADNNVLYTTVNDIDSLIASLEEASKSLFTWPPFGQF